MSIAGVGKGEPAPLLAVIWHDTELQRIGNHSERSKVCAGAFQIGSKNRHNPLSNSRWCARGKWVNKMSSKEITVPELAKRLERSIPYVQSLIRKGTIRGHKESKGWVTTAAAVEEYLAKRTDSATSSVSKKK